MGKPKNQPRIKGNVQPTSSSRAAEIVAASGAQVPNVVGLGGFQQFLGAAGPSTTSNPFLFTSSESLDNFQGNATNSIDTDLVFIFKKLVKRDATTKLKALEELEAYLRAKDGEGSVCQLEGAIGAWTKLYIRLAIDVDRRIRLATNSCHLLIVSKIKKRLAPHLKEIIGVWVISFFDQSKDVARIALESFQAAFPFEKHNEVLVFGQAEILGYTSEVIFEKSPETLSDPRFTSKEEMEQKYARVVSSSYYAISYLIEKLSIIELSKTLDQYNAIFNNEKTWKNSSHTSPLIRKSCYNLLKTLVVRWPGQVEERLELLSETYLSKIFSDNNPTSHVDLWDSLLVFTKNFPNSWTIAGKKKPMLPKLYHFLRSGAYGSINVSYPSLLVLIRILQSELISTGRKFYEEFLTNFWKGLSSGTIDRSNSTTFFKAYCECLMYFIVDLNKFQNQIDIQTYLVEQEFFRLVELYLIGFQSGESIFQAKEICSILASNMALLMSKSKTSGELIIKRINDLLTQTMNRGALLEQPSNRNAETDYKEFGKRMIEFLDSLWTNTNIALDDTKIILVERLVQDIFATSLAKSEQSKGQSEVLSFILSSLAQNFINLIFMKDATREALERFIKHILPGILMNASLESGFYYLDIWWIYYKQNTDSPKVQEIWDNLIVSILGIENTEKELDLLSYLVINQPFKKGRHTFLNDQFERFFTDLVQQLNAQLDKNIRAKVENFVIDIFLSEVLQLVNFLEPETRSSLLRHFSEVISKAAISYFVTEESIEISHESILSVLRIFAKLAQNDQFLEFFLDSEIASIIGHIYELTFLRSHGSSYEGTNSIRDLAQEFWQRTVTICVMESRKEKVTRAIFKVIKISILNIHYAASPTDFTQRIYKICETLYSNDQSKIKNLLSQFLLNELEWRALSEPFLSLKNDSNLFQGNFNWPLISNSLQTNRDGLQSNISYDSYGLSSYGRHGLFTIELFKKFGLQSFFNLNYDQEISAFEDSTKIKTSTSHLALLELILMYVLCTDIIDTHNTGNHIWDATTAEESNFLNFKSFLVDVRTILKKYLKGALSRAPVNLQDILEPSILESNIPEHILVVDLQGILLEAIKRTHGAHSRHWARVLQFLSANIFEETKLSIVDAERLLDSIKSESTNLNLNIKLAFIMSLKAYLKTSSKLKEFQLNLADKLCSLEATNIFKNDISADNIGWSHLSLLVATTIEDEEIFLPKVQSVALLQRIGTWYDVLQAEPEDFSSMGLFSVHIQIARLLNFMIPTIQEPLGNLWDLIFERIRDWLLTHRHLALRYEAIKLYNLLDRMDSSLSKEDNDDLSIKFNLEQPILFQLFANFLIEESAHKNHIFSNNYAAYLDTLCIACKKLPPALLLSNNSQLHELLSVPHLGIQRCAYLFLRTILYEKVINLSEELEIIGSSGGAIQPMFDESLLTQITRAHKENFLRMALTGDHNDLAFYHTFGYFLAWKLLFDHFDYATIKLKSHYIENIKDTDILDEFLPYVFETLGLIPSNSTQYTLSLWDFTDFFIEAFELEYAADPGFPVLAAHLYYRALKHIPSVVRGWWGQCKKRQLHLAVDAYTEKYFSSVIAQQQIEYIQRDDVKSQLQDENMSIRIARNSNEVIAIYRLDEYVMELNLRMPNNFPLRPIEVHTVERVIMTEIKDLKWAQLPVQAAVNSQNGNLEVALNLFKRNISLHFDGFEDCVICYSIVSLEDRSLPNKTCPTCRNRFHKSCLYKWFRTSNSSTCPLCRQEFQK
ncbi:hypothetical protein G9A89_023507 [Geosiphon pyriformis]|nr:hypothetical protein G9A89_023507 [Geosiphon pyriformis]